MQKKRREKVSIYIYQTNEMLNNKVANKHPVYTSLYTQH